MSIAHLGTGSEEPPKAEGLLRLYSMEFCPYAQRVRLVLNAKKIPHDIVNINLINKPEWYFKIHQEGKVPAIDTGNEVVVESLDISDYLDEKYAESPLYPKDPEARKRDKELIEKIAPLTGVFTKCVFGLEKKTPEEWAKAFTPLLEEFENELGKRGTLYFGGENPGMVDYMLWPWGERAGVIPKYVVQLPFGSDQFPLLKKWRGALKDYPVTKEMYHGADKFWKVIQFKLKNLPPDYDGI